ncbi:FKBP-type peptidyl prolyl cis-trans isomerase /Apo-metallochaperone SlyD [Sulfurivirga caldicuralii]|uniref:Peptidyl-prolyl cis-trans isomerase n=1 Tax=Sulfurivirga caldicuralii TaxID=364032 RepID=A0A1N6EZ28_9GAMM|nr:peptidylprolyl isomerase [Sulfurivirga caldicuralii]SIN88269.1 FKBP-type peptidyl prolyl cis-trans isomerase /Apo-metallochaperone SlyD [Sulfurivirga caldicuralii]
MKVAKDKVVSIEYVLKDKDGNVMDASNGQPLAYLHGHGQIIPGLEKALEGKEVGEKLTVTVPAAEAYGERVEQLVQEVPRQLFQGVDNIEVGMRFEAQSEQGVHSVEVTKVEGDTITVDGNHPLAGQDLTFEVEIKGVRDATEDELADGHAHGTGGVEH